MSTEWLALLGILGAAALALVGIFVKGSYDSRIARLDDRAKLTASTLAEVDSLRKDSDASDKQMREMRSEIQQSQRDSLTAQRANLDCERRCAELTTEVRNLRADVATLKALVARWQTATGQEVPP